MISINTSEVHSPHRPSSTLSVTSPISPSSPKSRRTDNKHSPSDIPPSTYESNTSDNATASTLSPKEIVIIRPSEIGTLTKKLKYVLKRKEKELNHFVDSLEKISNRRLEERNRKLTERNEVEKARILKERKNIETWDKFVYEIDSRIEDQTVKVLHPYMLNIILLSVLQLKLMIVHILLPLSEQLVYIAVMKSTNNSPNGFAQ